MFVPVEVLKQENVINTNRAHLPRLRVVAGFAAGFVGGACTGFRAGSIMFLQGNNVKVFVKIKVLKSQGVKCKCTYGVTLPREYLQVAGVVAEVVSPYPVFMEQFSAGHHHTHLRRLLTSLP